MSSESLCGGFDEVEFGASTRPATKVFEYFSDLHTNVFQNERRQNLTGSRGFRVQETFCEACRPSGNNNKKEAGKSEGGTRGPHQNGIMYN